MKIDNCFKKIHLKKVVISSKNNLKIVLLEKISIDSFNDK